MKWTEPQYEAITYKNEKDVLVAAAAGSGKTAVLVERIIQKILDPENPISVDEILALTFTDAAAKEMKNKISSAIEKKLKEQPENKHLKAQSIRVASADISTIHSFAKKIIENNIHLTDIPAGFTIIDSAENEFLLEEALNSCMERYYSHIEAVPPFSELAAGYGGIKNDNNLRNAILRLYDFSKSMAQPVKWLSHAANMYGEVYKNGSIAGTSWDSLYIKCIKNHIRRILGYYDIMNDIAKQSFFKDDKISIFVKEETEMLRAILQCGSLDEYFDYLPNVKFRTKPSVRTKYEALKYASDCITDLRKTAKSEFSKPGFMNFKSISDASDPIIKLYPRVKTLKNIVLMLMREHTKLKRKNSYLDFDDLEHELIKLLMNRDGSPTQFCKTLGSKYREILVDEYQDTNNIQDTLFKLLSDGRGNIFMVGDLKQSIYRFRNASPELFLDKYLRFGASDNEGRLIRLSNNFRSRASVVDTVNFVFSQIMHEDIADIEYTEDEYLHQSADYPDADSESAYGAEMLLTDVLESNTFGEQSASGKIGASDNKRELEAETVAKRILRLMFEEDFKVTDKESGRLRPIEFGDIVILCRSTKSAAPAFEKVFYKYGIPLNSNADSGFLESIEVKTVISFLQIIDNPLQDIPLVAALRSPMFGFTADDLAIIRAESRSGYFFDALQNSADKGDTKSKNFIKTLEDLRQKSAYMGVDELIYTIYSKLDYMSAVSAMPGGEIRKANLKLLFDRASSFERTSLKGLFNFVNYLERVGDSGNEMSQGKAAGCDSSVNLTTIHKSKGLEYPVVILAHTSGSSVHSDAFVFNEHAGVGMGYVDTRTRIRYTSPSLELIKYLNNKESFAEEMRLLYVAMTRAKEKLIISCTNEGRSKQWLKPYIGKNNTVGSVFVESTDIFRDWLVFAFLSHKDCGELSELMQTDVSKIAPAVGGGYFSFEYVRPIELKSEAESLENSGAFKTSETETASEPVTAKSAHMQESLVKLISAEDVSAVLGYRYPYQEFTHIPLKLSVSEIKERMNSYENDEENGGYTPKHISIADRSFKEVSKSKAAAIGTITHFVMQHIDPSETKNAEQIRAQISAMTAKNIITADQAEAVDADAVYEFFITDIGKRVIKAAQSNALNREFKFLIPVRADAVYKELDSYNNAAGTSPNIIVQGIVDCFFFEDDEIVLLDYKTDSCSEAGAEKRAEKYRIQAEFYAKGLEMIYNKRVKEKIIYFMKPRTAVVL